MEVRKGPGQLIQVQELEGELRKVTSFWSSKRRTYRLKAHILLVRKQQKNGVSEYKTKYDLSLYTVKLSVKDNLKFRLVPKDTNAKKSHFVPFPTRTEQGGSQQYVEPQRKTSLNP